MDARTETALKAFCKPGFPWLPMHPKASWTTRMTAALSAADAVEAPLAEQLATALRRILVMVDYSTIVPYEHHDIAIARDALAVFDAARADSQGTHQ